MSLTNPFPYGNYLDLFDTVLPDFVLAFAFFTSITYAVLSRRFEQQRPAVVMSAAIGAALSIGLVWWEYDHGLSIRDLGPVAVGFAVLILGGVIYQSIKGAGGSWAGAAIALGATLLLGWTVGLDWPVDRELIQVIITIALTVGILAFLLHRRGHNGPAYETSSGSNSPFSTWQDVAEVYQGRRTSRNLDKRFHQLKREAHDLKKEPGQHRDEAVDIILQLQRILPAEGWLTERLARLRAKLHLARKGSVARIAELEKHYSSLSPQAKRAAAKEMRNAYKQFNLDRRLERLDKAVAENERRIRELTRRAQQYMEAHDYRRLAGVLDDAARLQKHNTKLFNLIDRTEEKLLSIAKQALRKHQEAGHA